MNALTAQRGVATLQRLLQEQTFDVRDLDVAGFPRWLEGRLARWQTDPVFAQRSRIRDQRRACPELKALESAHRRASAADAASPQHPRLCRLERELIIAGKAIAGLTEALQRTEPERRPALCVKRDTFQARRETLEAEQARMIQSSFPRQDLLRIAAELERLRSDVGIDREEAELRDLMTRQGRRAGRSGETFERQAQTLTEQFVLPDVLWRAGARERLRVLRGVRLGAARLELDQVVVRLPPRAGPVTVLAVVEVKRNVNDLGQSFCQRQENLAWLTGEPDGCDPSQYRTRYFPSGHFDRDAVHVQDGERFLFDRRSFRRFRREPRAGPFLRRLYFITREGRLWGLSSAALARLGHRIATDDRDDPNGAACLREWFDWCRGLAGPMEAPDVLRTYASTPRLARQILVTGRGP